MIIHHLQRILFQNLVFLRLFSAAVKTAKFQTFYPRLFYCATLETLKHYSFNLSVRSRANKIRCKITHSKAIFEACSLLLLLIPLRPSKKCYKRIFWGYQLEPQRPKRPFSLLLWIFYPTTATLSSFSTNDEKQLNADVRYKRCQQCGQERLDYLFKNWNICISENLPKRINNCHSRFKILPNIK